jgi:hypothetical protein
VNTVLPAAALVLAPELEEDELEDDEVEDELEPPAEGVP